MTLKPLHLGPVGDFGASGSPVKGAAIHPMTSAKAFNNDHQHCGPTFLV